MLERSVLKPACVHHVHLIVISQSMGDVGPARFGRRCLASEGRLEPNDPSVQFGRDPDLVAKAPLKLARTSRETCRNKFKKEESKLFGRVAKESESERACRLRKAGKRGHAIYKPRTWPREVHSLPARSCIT